MLALVLLLTVQQHQVLIDVAFTKSAAQSGRWVCIPSDFVIDQPVRCIVSQVVIDIP